MSRKLLSILGLLVVFSMVLAACGAAEPETIVETVVVEQEKTVVETVEVEKEVAGEVFNIEV